MERLEQSFWTSKQRQGHSLHEISYRACFKPQLPEFFIGRFTSPGDRVLDPFMGRGTTPLQARLMGRVAVGSDVNPLCAYLTSPRLAPPRLAEVEARLHEIPQTAAVSSRDERLEVFFHPQVLSGLVALKDWFRARATAGTLDSLDAWVRMVALNRLTGHSSGFFSVRTMPPNQAVSLATQRKLNAKHGQSPPPRDMKAILLKKSKSLLRSGYPQAAGEAGEIAVASSDSLEYLAAGSVDLVVTSPPFLDTVDYRHDNWLRLWFADLEEEPIACDVHKSLEGWRCFIGATFRELSRVVRRGGHVAFEVGEVRKGTLQLEREVLKVVDGVAFAAKALYINVQQFTKTSNCWGVANNRLGTNSNRILLLQRV